MTPKPKPKTNSEDAADAKRDKAKGIKEDSARDKFLDNFKPHQKPKPRK